jgi:hypothetical protein
LFSYESLDQLSAMVKGQRRLRSRFPGLKDRIETARTEVAECKRFWNEHVLRACC